jgi:tRNA pseudouridine55 synthase
LKHKGKPLYKYARKGINVEIKPRKIFIDQINFLSLENNILKLEITCGKGTYIRVLAEDIANKAGSLGTLANLRRIKSAGYNIGDSLDLDCIDKDNFRDKIIAPGDALNSLDDIQCRSEIIEKITKGQKVEMKLTSEDKFLRLFDKKRNFVGIIENCNGFIKPKRLLTIDSN